MITVWEKSQSDHLNQTLLKWNVPHLKTCKVFLIRANIKQMICRSLHLSLLLCLQTGLKSMFSTEIMQSNLSNLQFNYYCFLRCLTSVDIETQFQDLFFQLNRYNLEWELSSWSILALNRVFWPHRKCVTWTKLALKIWYSPLLLPMPTEAQFYYDKNDSFWYE